MIKIDPLIRRFISGSLFAAVFVWVAIQYFGADPEVIKVLFLFSIGFVGGLMVLAILGAALLRLYRRLTRVEGTMLDHISSIESSREEE